MFYNLIFYFKLFANYDVIQISSVSCLVPGRQLWYENVDHFTGAANFYPHIFDDFMIVVAEY